jgi:antitoxin ParD1/3/4
MVKTMMIRKTISFTEQHDEWIKSRIASGDYASDSEYVRDLIRKDQRENEKFASLKAAIADGLNSGISERGVKDIMASVEEKLRTNGTLPPHTQS